MKGVYLMDSVYKLVEIVGTSSTSWEEAARKAVKTASKTIRDLRVAEIKEMDIKLDGEELLFRVKMNLSFKYED